ncbi:hypothetical protein PLICRDRAFT_100085 [Plicaturopsis crispa FD-325 SS-3]|nr:hypothetical protein PLICRDRAFT_100085 [Plicaturopsis crispa FD-325 SS-3]
MHARRSYATTKNSVHIVEVGPRDGLQNEKGTIPVDVKVELIDRLAAAGLKTIEAGSFVSPKWVPQMAGTAEVLTKMKKTAGVNYQVLVPNARGLQNYFSLLAASPSPLSPLPASEISIFTAATDAFTKANTNTTTAASLAALAPVAHDALQRGLRVRGYVSVVDTCPYSGRVDKRRVREVAKELLDMGCYEVSLGDTTGTATPQSTAALLEEVTKDIPVDRLAGHFHDTFGTAIANVFAALRLGVRTFDASVGGLGGCPYSPGATGNLATEDLLYALQGSSYLYPDIELEKVVEIGSWISGVLGRENASRAGRAIQARRSRDKPVSSKL